MKRPFTLYFSVFLAFLTLCIFTCSQKEDDEVVLSPLEVEPNVPAILAYLEAEDYKNKWKTFPGNPPGLKRLALPVHGRWVETFVNDIAYNFIEKVKAGKVQEPFVFPEGACIVKDNYRSSPKATRIAADQSHLKVLTFLFKPAAVFDYCPTSESASYNHIDCYGGGWFFGFHMIKGLPKLDSAVQHNRSSFCITCHAPSFNTDYVRTLNSQLHPFSQQSTEAYCDAFGVAEMSGKPMQLTAPKSRQEVNALKKALEAYCSLDKLSPELPSDVPFNPSEVFSALGHDKTQEMFDCYAWKTFISLNWPNKGPAPSGSPQRGEPDPAQPFTGARTGPTVWETYKPTFEVFQPNDSLWNPIEQAWNSPPAVLEGEGCKCENGEMILTMDSKSRSVANETGQAFAGSFGYLIDQNRKKVRYEVLFNRTEFDYLIADSRASTANLTPSGPKGGNVKFPDTKDDPRKEGSMEVKSAWKELCIGDTCEYPDASSLEEAMQRFYVRNVIIYEETKEGKKIKKSCRPAWAGLIGLHVIRKTYFAPQWIWMTFEHKDNVPEYGNTEQAATFFNPQAQASAETPCWNFPFLDTAAAVVGCPNVDLNRFFKDWKDQPNQLTRLVPIQTQADGQNKLFQEQMRAEGGSPFENYILVDTQWPLNGRNKNGEISSINCADNNLKEDCYKMVPRFLRNTVIESYMSTYCTVDDKNQQFSNRSCMSCHGQAGADFSYIWLDAVAQRINIKK